MVFQLADFDGLLAIHKNLHRAQLPVGNVGDLLAVAVQGEGGHLFGAQADDEFLVAGDTGGGFHEVQGLTGYLLVHIGDVGVHALELGVILVGAGAGGVACQPVELGPVGVAEELVKHLLAFDGGLGGFVVLQPAVEPVQRDKHADEEHENHQKVNGIEDDAAQTGAPPLLAHHLYLGLLFGRTGGGGLLGGEGGGALLRRAQRTLGTGGRPTGLLRGSGAAGLFGGLGGIALGTLPDDIVQRFRRGLLAPGFGVKFSLIHLHSPHCLGLTIQKLGILLGSDWSTE